jgi:hypothetical protein
MTTTLAKAKPQALRLPPVPASSLEREALLRVTAHEIVAWLGPSGARFLASLLDETCDEITCNDTVHVSQHLGEQAP